MLPDRSPVPSGHRALRKGRRSVSGQIYMVTTVCIDRTPFFARHDAAIAASQALQTSGWQGDARSLAWVLMPDHLHLLLELGERGTLSSVVMNTKSFLARHANAALGRNGALWQRGFHDRALRQDEDVRAAARYLVANPLRAGLVQTLGDYPYWNAVWLD